MRGGLQIITGDEYYRKLKILIAGAREREGLDERFSIHHVRFSEKHPFKLVVDRRLFIALRERPGVEITEPKGGGRRLREAASGIDIAIQIMDMEDENLLMVTAGSVNVRKQPSSGSELLTQALIGEELRSCRRDNGWHLIRMSDGYCGWVADRGVLSADRRNIEHYRMRVNKMVVSNAAKVYTEPENNSLCKEELVAGSRLAADDTGTSAFLRVTLPSGDEGFVRRGDIDDAGLSVKPEPAGILRRAAGFMGIPYLWGGATTRGFDCSGLVKRVFDMEGVVLPRDSDLQAECGEEIDPEDAVRSRPGALIFFSGGTGINHVAISAGRGNLIHSRGSVRIENLYHPDCSLSGNSLCKAVLVL